MPDAPSTEVIEQAVLGLGRHTADWFEQVPAPDGDGEVLVIMIDSKGAPTATDSELSRRRGERRHRRLPASPRHRGRHRRRRWGKKPRRKKGDKSKNARIATMVVMFTLKRHGTKLLGPINRKLYASFAPKRHAFAIARRDATKRGFGPGAGKLIQIVTDGDPDFATYATEYFPEAMHTVDVMHVIEKLWAAGECCFFEGGGGGALAGCSAATICLNSAWPNCWARSSSPGSMMRFKVWARCAAVLPSWLSLPRLAWLSNSAVIANQASAIAWSFGVTSPRS